jgi:hypothetical protein
LAAKIARENPTTMMRAARIPYQMSTLPTRLMSAAVIVERMTPISNATMPASRKTSR